ncbi:MFS general substrate transporter [Lepidopterella palustris CBS 459.81]|uniref:MFS general substrate transporter n=1 Tax=Lepidopterella palustris CBS 459.81 TaxID=1314670 RepID=A0A8E2ELC4_9PEZI|nr:MFS general substrate transporter [Lepidopterella palustris CBS 459.81]
MRPISLSAIRSSKAFILITICTATFTDGFISGLVTPVFPFLLREQKLVPEKDIQISTSILIAAFALADFFGAPLCAWYVDRSKSRPIPWYIGIFLISTGTAFFGLANRFWMLAISRILQGFSSSILYTVGLAVLVDTVERDEVGQWMGTAMSANNIGMILSPLVGGIVYEKAGKMVVFAIMAALGAIDIALRLLMKESKENSPMEVKVGNIPRRAASPAPPPVLENREGLHAQSPESPRLDPEASRLSAQELLHHPSITTLNSSYTSTKSETATNTPPSSTPSPSRRLPGILSLLHSPRLLAALYGCFINECIVTSLCAVLPLFVNSAFNWSSLQAGLLFLTIAIPAFAGPLAGALADRLGARWIAVAGFLLTAPSLILLRLVDHNSKEQVILLCVLLTLAGTTIILFLSPLGAECSFVAEEESKNQNMDLYASSFSLMNCALAAAGLLGPLAAGGLEQRFGWGATTIAMGVLCVSGAVPCALATGGKRVDAMEGEHDV